MKDGIGLPLVVWAASAVVSDEEPDALLVEALGAQDLLAHARSISADRGQT